MSFFLRRSILGSLAISDNLSYKNTFKYDGNGSAYLQADGNPAVYNFTGNFTISAWFYTTDTGANTIVVAKGASGGDADGISYYINARVDDDWSYVVYNSGGVFNGSSDFGSAPSAYTWYHTCLVGDTDTLRFYVNGTEIDNTTGWDGTVFESNKNFTVGSFSEGGGDYEASWSATKVYDIALSASDITELYNSGSPKPHSDLSATLTGSNCIGAWELAKDLPSQGLEYTDQSTQGNTLTVGAAASGTGSITGQKLGFDESSQTTADYNTLLLNGSSQYVSIADSVSTSITDAITFGGWYDISTGSQQALISKWNPSGSQKSYELVYNTATDDVSFYLTPDGSTNSNVTSSVSGIGGSGWRHILGWYDGTNIKIYVDGSEEGSAAYSSGIFDSTSSVLIGAEAAGVTTLNGNASLQLICNAALTTDDITELYNSGVAKQPWEYSESITNNYVLALPLNDGVATGRENEDFSGNENDGTLVGSPTYTGTALTYDVATKYNAFGFDGSTQSVTITDSASLTTSEASYSIWFNLATGASTSGQLRLWDRVGSNVNTRFFLGWQGGVDTMRLLVKLGGTQIATNGTFSPTKDTWHHALVSYDGTETNVYFDGNTTADITITLSGDWTQDASDTHIGVDDGTTQNWDGSLAQPMIFGTGLTASDAATLYNKNLPLQYDQIPTSITDNAVLAYAMNSNDNSLTDLSTQTNDGTAVGGVTSDGSEIDWDTADVFLTYNHTWSGNADIQSNEAELDGTSLTAVLVDDTVPELAGNDFTIENIMTFDSFIGVAASYYNTISSKWGNAGNTDIGWLFSYQTDSGALRFLYSVDGVNVVTLESTSTTTLVTGTEYHLAVVRDGTNISFYVDGVKLGNSVSIGTAVIADTDRNIIYGAYYDTFVIAEIDGRINYAKISDFAAYDANFTAPSTLTNDAKTIYLNTFNGDNGSTPLLNTEEI